jgi:hypothetical protein
VRHSESVELGRAQAVYLLWDKLGDILIETCDLGEGLFDEVDELVNSLYKYASDYANDNPCLREEIKAGAKDLGEKLGCN